MQAAEVFITPGTISQKKVISGGKKRNHNCCTGLVTVAG
ncbi:hypothetical protein V6Z11_A08G247100 [Gossypium hirsutum]